MTDLASKAKEFAYKAHDGQTRKGKLAPFTDHLDMVVEIIKGLTSNDELIAAAWLHDTVEDTDVTIDEIYENFGPIVGRYVEIESEDKMPSMSENTSWKARKDDQIARMSALEGTDKLVYMITLSDKLANLREMNEDYKILGDKLWEKFNNQNPNDHKWYYSTMGSLTLRLPEIKGTKESKELNAIIDELFGK